MGPMKKQSGKVKFILRDCPTPVDDTQKLITHKVSLGTCLARQANRYHKCFSCKWREGGTGHKRAAAAGG